MVNSKSQSSAFTHAVIFDMDGVIVNSEPHHKRAFYDVIREVGHTSGLEMKFEDYVGRSDFEMWHDYVAKYNPPHTAENLIARKRSRVIQVMKDQEPIFPGVPELAARLAAKNALAVASGSEHLVIDAVLALKGLKRHFPVVVSSADVKHGKPAPDIFLRAAELLKIKPENCWAIEDSKPGVESALAAGMRVIAITNTHAAGDLARATHVVRSYHEIESILMH